MLILFFLLASVLVISAAAQIDNSCAYTFTYSKQSFKFCLTSYGTLGMLQAPIGTDLLDSANPVEGYWYDEITYIQGGFLGSPGSQIPGLGQTDDGQCLPPGAYQNKLPLSFGCGRFNITVTANPNQESVTFVMKDQNYGPYMWYSGMYRGINVLPNAAVTPLARNTPLSSFVYVDNPTEYVNPGVMISVPLNNRFNYRWATGSNGCPGGPGAGLCADATEGNYGRGTTSLTLTYKVF